LDSHKTRLSQVLQESVEEVFRGVGIITTVWLQIFSIMKIGRLLNELSIGHEMLIVYCHLVDVGLKYKVGIVIHLGTNRFVAAVVFTFNSVRSHHTQPSTTTR